LSAADAVEVAYHNHISKIKKVVIRRTKGHIPYYNRGNTPLFLCLEGVGGREKTSNVEPVEYGQVLLLIAPKE
jgi:hypothetical protein